MDEQVNLEVFDNMKSDDGSSSTYRNQHPTLHGGVLTGADADSSHWNRSFAADPSRGIPSAHSLDSSSVMDNLAASNVIDVDIMWRGTQ